MSKSGKQRASKEPERLTAHQYIELAQGFLGRQVTMSDDVSVARAEMQSAMKEVINDDHLEEVNEGIKKAPDFVHAKGVAVYALRHYRKSGGNEKAAMRKLAKSVPTPAPREPDQTEEGTDDMAKTATAKKSLAKAKTGKVAAAANGSGKRAAANQQMMFVVAEENPRREGTNGWRSFEIVRKAGKKGLTIEAFLSGGGRMIDARWDEGKGNIKFGPVPKAVPASSVASWRRHSK